MSQSGAEATVWMQIWGTKNIHTHTLTVTLTANAHKQVPTDCSPLWHGLEYNKIEPFLIKKDRVFGVCIVWHEVGQCLSVHYCVHLYHYYKALDSLWQTSWLNVKRQEEGGVGGRIRRYVYSNKSSRWVQFQDWICCSKSVMKHPRAPRHQVWFVCAWIYSPRSRNKQQSISSCILKQIQCNNIMSSYQSRQSIKNIEKTHAENKKKPQNMETRFIDKWNPYVWLVSSKQLQKSLKTQVRPRNEAKWRGKRRVQER